MLIILLLLMLCLLVLLLLGYHHHNLWEWWLVVISTTLVMLISPNMCDSVRLFVDVRYMIEKENHIGYNNLTLTPRWGVPPALPSVPAASAATTVHLHCQVAPLLLLPPHPPHHLLQQTHPLPNQYLSHSFQWSDFLFPLPQEWWMVCSDFQSGPLYMQVY